MSFKDFFFGLPHPERVQYAESAATSVAMLSQVAYGNKRVELGFADVLVAVSRGRLSLEQIPMTGRAVAQHAIRTAPVKQAACFDRVCGDAPLPVTADHPAPIPTSLVPSHAG